jgi:predicted DNA-binding transcriptional regulator YafY
MGICSVSLENEKRVVIDYTNWKGSRRQRIVIPSCIFLGANEYHKDVQWLLLAKDTEDEKEKTFAMNNVHRWETFKAVTFIDMDEKCREPNDL